MDITNAKREHGKRSRGMALMFRRNGSRDRERLGYSEERMALEHVGAVGIKGIRFLYRALLPEDFMDQRIHPFWTSKDEAGKMLDDANMARQAKLNPEEPKDALKLLAQMRENYKPVLLKGVLWPRITEDGAGDTIPLEDLFIDPEVAARLYMAIMTASLKKKNPVISSLLKPLSWMLWRTGTVFSPRRWRGSGMRTTPSVSLSSSLRGG